MIEQFVKYFVLLFVVIEPVSLVPLFGALTRGNTDRERRRIAMKSTILAAIILFVFAIAGDYLLKLLGITVDAFKIGGGLLLFMLAVDMVFARHSGLRSATVREQDEARYREDISVFPMAFPLLAGPGSLATVLLLTGEARGDWIMISVMLGVLALVLVITLVLLLLTPQVMRVLGLTGANVISRLLGVVLVALAVQFVVDGVRSLFAL